MAEARKAIQQQIGWLRLAKQVSDYTHETYFQIMDRPALEVSGIAYLISMETQLNKLK